MFLEVVDIGEDGGAGGAVDFENWTRFCCVFLRFRVVYGLEALVAVELEVVEGLFLNWR